MNFPSEFNHINSTALNMSYRDFLIYCNFNYNNCEPNNFRIKLIWVDNYHFASTFLEFVTVNKWIKYT